MSYCRFSSDNFKSDIYCFEHCGGWFQIWVASVKIVSELPERGDILCGSVEKYRAKEKVWRKAFNEAKRQDIDLLYAGEGFECDTLSGMKDKLLELKEIGYHVPDSAFKIIDEELKDESL